MIKKLHYLFFLISISINAQNEFITVWETTINSENITIPVSSSGGTINYNVDWGDGTMSNGVTGDATHTYATAGFYSVKILGDFPGIFLNNSDDKLKIKSIEQWGNIVWKSMAFSYSGCSNLVVNASDDPNLTSVTSLLAMFQNCTLLGTGTSTGWNFWDVTTITNMNSMFSGATNFNKAIGNWVVANVTNMNYMFQGVTNFDQPIQNWDTSKVTNMNSMFSGASSFNQSLEFWDVSKVTNMSFLFEGATAFNGNITNWDTSSATNMSYLFYNATSFNQAIGNWNTANVTNMSGMFSGATSFNQPLSTNTNSWNTSKVTNMSFLFSEATAFNGNVTNWDTSSATTMFGMFRNATAFNQDVSNWNIGLVTDMTAMFLNVTLSTINYDALLTSFANQTTQNNVNFSGGNSVYCTSAPDRQKLVDAPKSWSITDGGIQTTTWTGIVDSDWTNTANWTNCLPTLYHDVVISNTVANMPTINSNTNAFVKNLTIDSGANLTVFDKGSLNVNNNLINNGQLQAYAFTGSGSILCNGNYTGNDLTYYLRLTPNKWFLVNSPVIGQDIYDFVSYSGNGIITSASNNYSIAPYDNNASNSSNTWAYYNTTNLTSSGTVFATGKGYATRRNSGGGSLYSAFLGKILNGDAAIPVTVGSYNSWNLVGNPYTSFLSVSDFLTTNASLLKPTHQALYVWDNDANAGSGGYVTITGNVFAPVGQAFFVNAQSNGSLSITKSMQSHQTSKITILEQ